MTSSKLETQRKSILHLWRKGTHNAAEIHSLTKIPLKTIYRNLKKIEDTGDVKRKNGSGRIKKITPTAIPGNWAVYSKGTLNFFWVCCC